MFDLFQLNNDYISLLLLLQQTLFLEGDILFRISDFVYIMLGLFTITSAIVGVIQFRNGSRAWWIICKIILTTMFWVIISGFIFYIDWNL